MRPKERESRDFVPFLLKYSSGSLGWGGAAPVGVEEQSSLLCWKRDPLSTVHHTGMHWKVH